MRPGTGLSVAAVLADAGLCPGQAEAFVVTEN